MKTTNVFVIAALFCGSYGFAEWRDSRFVKEDMTEDRIMSCFLEYDKEFVLPAERSKNGFIIFAIDTSFSSRVKLRYLNNRVDYEVGFLNALYSCSGSVYLNLLDEDKFLVESVFISRVGEEFKGTIRGNFDMKWDSFSRVKYYDISMRG